MGFSSFLESDLLLCLCPCAPNPLSAPCIKRQEVFCKCQGKRSRSELLRPQIDLATSESSSSSVILIQWPIHSLAVSKLFILCNCHSLMHSLVKLATSFEFARKRRKEWKEKEQIPLETCRHVNRIPCDQGAEPCFVKDSEFVRPHPGWQEKLSYGLPVTLKTTKGESLQNVCMTELRDEKTLLSSFSFQYFLWDKLLSAQKENPFQSIFDSSNSWRTEISGPRFLLQKKFDWTTGRDGNFPKDNMHHFISTIRSQDFSPEVQTWNGVACSCFVSLSQLLSRKRRGFHEVPTEVSSDQIATSWVHHESHAWATFLHGRESCWLVSADCHKSSWCM